jgi:hypothetical protein
MSIVSLSLWLPVGRANFFNVSDDRELLHLQSGTSELKCSPRTGHHPNLQVSTMRRLLEVLPVYYGYEDISLYEQSLELAEDTRPIKVILTLHPEFDYQGIASQRRLQANGDLLQAGITSVTLTVSEDGFFTWTAADGITGDDRNEVQIANALRTHIIELFGGNFSLRRYDPDSQLSGRTAVEVYRGLGESGATGNGNAPASSEKGPNNNQRPGSAPLGILTFFQMNTLLEGLINEILIPAVFFEDYAFLKKWMSEDAGRRGFRSIGGFVDLIIVEVDATLVEGRINALDHFLAVTAREVLQKIKWSVESVRRGLLDEMMSVLHRQSSLTQLTLGEAEQSPEQAIGANESQLRGYVMLAAAKLPLITNVARYASAACTRIDLELKAPVTSTVGYKVFEPAASRLDGELTGATEDLSQVSLRDQRISAQEYSDLEYQLSEWRGLLDAVQENIHGLENAIEHAWMERLLYEQEQVRAEQEAMAEIERSRNGRRPLISFETVINAAVLVFAVAAVVLTAKSAASPQPHQSVLNDLLLPSILGLIVLAAALGWAVITRYLKVWRSRTDVYDYEFAFRLDLEVSESRTRAFLERHKPQAVEDTGFKKFKIVRLGGARIERITPDSSLVKLHSAIVLRPETRFWRRSRERFEVVSEVLAHRVSSKNQYVLRETRIFGDTRKPLPPESVVTLVRAILIATAGQLVPNKLDVDKVVNLAAAVFYDQDKSLAEPDSAELRTKVSTAR